MKVSRSLSYLVCGCLVLVLIICGFLTACTKSAPAPAPTTPTPSPEPTPAPVEPVELKFSHHLPPTSPVAQALEEWAKKVESDTDGAVTFTIYPSSSLASGRDAFASTESGVCDVAFINNVYMGDRWALNNVVNLTSLPFPDTKEGIAVWDTLWEKYPEMVQEFAGTHVLFHSISGTTSLHTKKAVRVPNDTKGMKISAMGDSVKVLQAAGASPATIPANDWYMSLEKGVIEGVYSPINVVADRGIEELIENHLDVGVGQSGNTVLINAKRWDSFSSDIQAKFNELNSWACENVMAANSQICDNAWKKCESLAGHTVVRVTPEEKKLWAACGVPAAEEWMEQSKDKGPVKEIYNTAEQLLAEIK